MSTTEELEKLIAPKIADDKCELVDLQYVKEAGKMVLRLFVDKEGGIKLSDCEVISREIGDLVDNSNIIGSQYVLEVSSPGLDRVLKKESDFKKFCGRKAKITVFAPINGQRHFVGKMLSCNEGVVKVMDESALKEVEIEIAKIAHAKLEPEIGF